MDKLGDWVDQGTSPNFETSRPLNLFLKTSMVLLCAVCTYVRTILKPYSLEYLIAGSRLSP